MDKFTYVKVEQRHIDKGVYKSVSDCAVALAIKEQLPVAHVTVTDRTIFVRGSEFGRRYVANTTLRLTRFIHAFDSESSSKEVKPMRFRLRFEEV